MSYVAITNRLEMAMTHQLHTMRDIELRAEKQPEQPTFSGSEAFFDSLWGPLKGTPYRGHPDLIVKGGKSCHFMILDRDPMSGPSNAQAEGRHITHCRANAVCLPRHACTDARGDNVYNFQLYVFRGDHPWFEETANYLVATKEIKDRWQKHENQLREFLKSCKSLNEAIKLWPDIRRYVPADDLARHDEKVVKEKRDQSEAMRKLAAMDLDSLAASTVLSRMVGASE
jgi:hypothetical protein